MIPDKLRIAHILDSAAQLSEIVSHPKDETLAVRANRDSLCYNFILISWMRELRLRKEMILPRDSWPVRAELGFELRPP